MFVYSHIVLASILHILLIKPQHSQVLKNCVCVCNDGTLMYLYVYLTQALNLRKHAQETQQLLMFSERCHEDTQNLTSILLLVYVF